MKFILNFKTLFKFLLLLICMSSSIFANTIIPRKVLFGNPDKVAVKLSPDGKYISYLAPKEGVLNVHVALSNDPTNAQPVTNDTSRGIRIYHWAYDNEHILYSQDEKGDENFRIYSYSLKTKETKLLTPEKGVKAFIYGKSERHPNEILIGLNERDKRYFDIYKVDLIKGSKELILENNKFANFVIDDDLKVRFGEVSTEDGGSEYFQLIDKEWKSFMKISADDSTNTGILGFDKTGEIIYLTDSRDRDTAAIKMLNLKTGKSEIIAEDEKADVDIFMMHPLEKKIQAVSVNYDKITYHVIDDSIKEDIEYLKRLDKGELIINSRTLDDKIWLVAFLNDTNPVKYYFYKRKDKGAAYLFSNRKDLENYKLAPMYPVIIKSRDGLNLVSYLTLPVQEKIDEKLRPQKPLPLVLYVHGGPWVRDSWGLDNAHQWLANRGYAVLSVNFRISTGFGKNFANAGNRQWGKKMHDDLIDGVNWAIKNNIADPAKIAIMGGSYGGYATLIGLTFTPDVFACGIDVVGPSNLLTLINSVPPYWEPILSLFKKKVGPWETEEDKKALAQISPINFVDKIKKPLFIAQGANDPRVKQAESDQIVETMQSKNIPVVYALYKDEGHGFVRPENKLSYYALIEHFLAKILGGRAETIGNDLKGADFLLNGKVPENSQEAEKIVNEAIY